jgi:hypothetical protein
MCSENAHSGLDYIIISDIIRARRALSMTYNWVDKLVGFEPFKVKITLTSRFTLQGVIEV